MLDRARAALLVCPSDKSELILTDVEETSLGVIKTGMLYCDSCQRHVASVRHGKVDFLRVEPITPSLCSCICESFHFKRIPWSHEAISQRGCEPFDLGWNSEGYQGCLRALGGDWRIEIITAATDVSLRFLTHDWSGTLEVWINDQFLRFIDLYSAARQEVNSYELFRNMTGSKHISLIPAPKNTSSKDSQIYFFGMDAVFEGEDPFQGGNRGNGFPAAYEWVLGKLQAKALVLDCGSGDRKYPDPRVISLEYMPFEFPEIYADGHALPFADGVFDAVFSQAVMEHMRDPYLASREMARILKPGGLIYVDSAFMQPLHAVPYHFFNTTVWGLEAIFLDAGIDVMSTEWFGPLSGSIEWYLEACGGGGLTEVEREQIKKLFKKVDDNVSYEQLKSVASAVSLWGIKNGTFSEWYELLKCQQKPSFGYSK